MRSGRAALVAIFALSWGQAAVARAAEPTEPPRKTVSELVVTANKTVAELVVTAPVKCPTVHGLNLDLPKKPAVVATFPAAGQTVRPGLVVIRVTFDRPVACAGGLANDPPLANPCPDRVQHMVLSYDRRTVRTVCLLEPDTLYGVRLNRDPGSAFRTVDGAVGEEFSLRFATTLDAPLTDVCEAVREDAQMLPEVEKAHALDCAPKGDPQADMVKAEVERRDAAARAERDRAIAEAQVRRDKLAADELAHAEKLALAAYRKARDRNWANARAPTARRDAASADDHLVDNGFAFGNSTTPGSFNHAMLDNAVLPKRPAGAAAPRLKEPTIAPELTDWRQSFVIGTTTYDCALRDHAVVCTRR